MKTDRGWAWVVLVASMCCNYLLGVLCYFVGVVHTGLLAKFRASVTTTAWVGALYSANMSLTAPLASVIINRFGCRVCCIVGGLFSFLGFTASAFVPSISWLFLTYGLLAGLGLGLTYSPTIITVGLYFDKLRGLASGLSVGSAALGILSGSLIAQALIEAYSVSGAFLLIGAVSANCCLFGMFYRPTDFEKKGFEMDVVELNRQTNVIEHRSSAFSLAMHGVEIRSSTSSIHKDRERKLPGYGSVTSLLRKAQTNRLWQSVENTSLASSMKSSDIFHGRNIKQTGSISVLVPNGDVLHVECQKCSWEGSKTGDSNANDDAVVVLSERLVHSPKCCLDYASLEKKDEGKLDNEGIPSVHTDGNSLEKEAGEQHTPNQPSVGDKAVTESTNLLHPETPSSHTIQHLLTSSDVTTDVISHLNDVISDGDQPEDLQSETPLHSPSWKGQRAARLQDRLVQAVDSYLAIFANKSFMLHCVGVLLANVHISGVYIHLPEYVQLQGTEPTQSAALFVAVGFFSLLSRLASGFATTDSRIEAVTLHIGMMGLCGLSTALFPFYSATYVGQLVFSSLFGLYTGGLYALVTVLTIHFVGLSVLSTAFGIMVFAMGIGYLVGPPLAALIVESGWSYEESFTFLGAMMLAGSFLDMAAVYFSKSRDSDRLDREAEEELEVASINRDWLGSSIIISVQDLSSAHAHCDVGSVMSLRSPYSSQDAKI